MPTVDLSAAKRRRLQVAREFIHDMDLLFLDEPTVGLDPIVRRSVLDYLKERVPTRSHDLLHDPHPRRGRVPLQPDRRDQPGPDRANRPLRKNLKRRFGSAKAVEFKLLQGTSSEMGLCLSSSASVSRFGRDEGFRRLSGHDDARIRDPRDLPPRGPTQPDRVVHLHFGDDPRRRVHQLVTEDEKAVANGGRAS